MEGCCDRGDEPLDSMNCKKFFEYLRAYQLLKKDPAAWIWLGL